jgi:hypothetical protein
MESDDDFDLDDVDVEKSAHDCDANDATLKFSLADFGDQVPILPKVTKIFVITNICKKVTNIFVITNICKKKLQIYL